MRVLLWFTLLLSPAFAVPTVNVSPTGNDAWSGSLPEPNAARTDGPVATLERARDLLRGLPHDQPREVRLRAGTYRLKQTFTLGPEDSGTAEAPITYAPAEGDHVVLSGGQPITGWRREGKLLVADVPADWHFRQVLADGRLQTRARYPNADPSDPLRGGYLFVPPYGPGYGSIYSALAAKGDFLVYQFTAPAAGDYVLWASYATIIENYHSATLKVDGQPVELPPLPASGSWRKVVWTKLATVHLAAGEHELRWDHIGEGRLPIHFDAFLFTTNPDLQPTAEDPPLPAAGEQRLVIQGETPLDVSSTYGTNTFLTDSRRKPTRTELRCPGGEVKPAWLDAPDAEVHAFTAQGWFNQITPIAGGDVAASTLTLSGKECQGDLRPGNRFCVENVREELDSPGEWYLDEAAHEVTWWPPDGLGADSLVEAPRVITLVALQSDATRPERVEHVTLRGFELTCTDYTIDQPALRCDLDAAVLLDGARHCMVVDCRIHDVGGYAIRLHLDSTDNRIAGNELYDLGAGGVILTSSLVSYSTTIDPRPEVKDQAPLRCVIEGNRIHHGGRFRKYVAGIQLDSRPDSTRQAEGNRVADNVIYTMPRNGIFTFRGQGGNLVEGNHLCDLLRESDDGAAIHFSTCHYDDAPSTVRNNVIHDVWGWRIGSDGQATRQRGHGIYLDNLTSHCLVEGNVVHHTSGGGFMMNGGQGHTVQHNVFADDLSNQLCLYNCGGKMRELRLAHNVIAWSNPDGTLAEITAWAVGDRTTACRRETIANPGALMTVDQNLLWHDGLPILVHPTDPHNADGWIGPLERWRKLGQDVHSVVADPLFIDREHGDYRLLDDSPAYRLGFQHLTVDPTVCPRH